MTIKYKNPYGDSSFETFNKEHAEYQKKMKMQRLKNRDKEFPCILARKFAVKKDN